MLGVVVFSWLAAAFVAGGLVVALAIDASRVLLNVHFVSDVLARFAVGLAWLCCCAIVRDVLRARPQLRSPDG